MLFVAPRHREPSPPPVPEPHIRPTPRDHFPRTISLRHLRSRNTASVEASRRAYSALPAQGYRQAAPAHWQPGTASQRQAADTPAGSKSAAMCGRTAPRGHRCKQGQPSRTSAKARRRRDGPDSLHWRRDARRLGGQPRGDSGVLAVRQDGGRRVSGRAPVVTGPVPQTETPDLRPCCPLLGTERPASYYERCHHNGRLNSPICHRGTGLISARTCAAPSAGLLATWIPEWIGPRS